MGTRKQADTKEPLLSTVARKLGQAAGAVTNVAQGLLAREGTENSPPLSKTLTTSTRRKANTAAATEPASARTVRPAKKRGRRVTGAAPRAKRAAPKRKRSRS
jgi:hypothetical protein